MVRASSWIALVLAMVVSGAARAQTLPDDSDKASAQALFDKGRQAMEDGRIAEACESFAESQRLDPALGTRFNLADCYEQLGKLASAWVHYVGTADMALRLGQSDREAFARERARALEPRLSRLEIRVPHPVDGLVVTRNETTIGTAQFDEAVPVDIGEYQLEARAPGYEPYRQTVTVSEEGETVSVTLPELVPLPPPPPPPEPAPGTPTVVVAPPPPRPPPPGGISGQEIAALSVGGAGLIAFGVGSAFGLIAKSKKDESEPRCPSSTQCFADGAELIDQARTAGNVATGLFIAGGVLAVGGLVLWFTAPDPESARVGVTLSPGSAGLVGRW
ncbi:MAG TPA: PEGA domain-containing protein [Polyangiaceae bacterium]|nr:PEGA domain-containing protein [Polyangiaceae bacterium]